MGKLHEEFLKAFESQNKYKPTRAEYGDGWSTPFEEGAWWGWNASREAIEIKLPKAMKGPKGDGLDGDYEEFETHEAVAGEVNSMRAKCAKAIKAAGVKVKA
jgi:hypothetical protein